MRIILPLLLLVHISLAAQGPSGLHGGQKQVANIRRETQGRKARLKRIRVKDTVAHIVTDGSRAADGSRKDPSSVAGSGHPGASADGLHSQLDKDPLRAASVDTGPAYWSAGDRADPVGGAVRSFPSARVEAQGAEPNRTTATVAPADMGLAPWNATTPEGRRAAVVAAAKHAWRGYEAYAMGYDELMPVSGAGKNTFGGLGTTVVDSLDTLWVLGLKDEFATARNWVAEKLDFDRNFNVSVFETVIREVGGLLSAFELSGDRVFLSKAEELGDILIKAYDSPTGIPYQALDLHSHMPEVNPDSQSVLSEFGTQQMEYITLSDKIGRPEFAAKAEAVIRALHQTLPDQGLMPLFFSTKTGQPTTNAISMGAMGDSYYEYLLKVWILKGKGEENELYRSMWEKSMDDAFDRLVHKNNASGLTYLSEVAPFAGNVAKMDHLACFAPAMLALGVHARAVTGSKAARYLALAEELTRTCWQMYAQMATGLAPEHVLFTENGMIPGSGAAHNLLRPEAMEAAFLLWRVTGKQMYQEWAWSMFQAFERHSKARQLNITPRVANGYAGVRDVTRLPAVHDDTMQSFWLAETLRYAYMIFSPADVLDLDTYVLNTECHPLHVLKRAPPSKV